MTSTKQQIEKFIDRLTDKSLTFGCRLYDKVESRYGIIVGENPKVSLGFYVKWENCYAPSDMYILRDSICILGKPIMDTDILSRMWANSISEYEIVKNIEMLSNLWKPFGSTRSFQDIVNESGWERVLWCGDCDTDKCGQYGEGHDRFNKEQLKDPNARALAEFLLGLNL